MNGERLGHVAIRAIELKKKKKKVYFLSSIFPVATCKIIPSLPP